MHPRLTLAASVVLAASLVFTACASSRDARRAEPYDLSAAADSMARAVSSEGADLPSLRAGIESYLSFIAEERGPEAGAALAAMRKPGDLAPFLAAKYGTTTYQEAIAAFMNWASHPKGPRWDPSAASRLETEHFVVVAMPGTPGYADRDYVARLLEAQAKNVGDLIGPNAKMAEAAARNLASIRGRKIEVDLPPDPRGLKDFGDTANSSYGLVADESGLGLTASIVLPYYNAFSSAILTHEETHFLDIFFKLDARSAPPLPAADAPKSEKEAAMKAFAAWAGPTFEAIVPSDKGFGEGFAEYAAMRFSPLHRAFFPDPDALLRVMCARVPPLPDVLAASPTVKDRMVRVVRYTELNSLVTYLIDHYGLERFLDFYMSAPVSEDRFTQVYGEGYKAIQAEWRAARPPR